MNKGETEMVLRHLLFAVNSLKEAVVQQHPYQDIIEIVEEHLKAAKSIIKL